MLGERLLQVGNLRILLVLLLLMLPLHIAIKGVEAKDVLTSASELKEVYRKGEEMVIYVSVFNNHSGTNILNITEVNTTIWRIEKRYNRWRNIERVYSRTREIGQLINPGEGFSKSLIHSFTGNSILSHQFTLRAALTIN